MELFAVALPIRVEDQLPDPRLREPEGIVFAGVAVEVGHDHDFVVRAPAIPTSERDDVHVVVDVRDGDVWTGQPPTRPLFVQPQVDQIPVHAHDAAECLGLLPVQRHRVAEPFALHELLPLEKHRDARRGHHERRGEGGALLGEPVGGPIRVDLLRNARPAVGHFVVRFAVDHPPEGIVVVAAQDRVLHRFHGPVLVRAGDDRFANRVDELRIPLRPERGPAVLGGIGDGGDVLQIFRDGERLRVVLADLGVDPPHQAPALG